MKKHLLFLLMTFMSIMGVQAQASYTFKAVALNVDGLPEKISGITINSGAPAAAGATTICNYLANSSWDIVGFSEDFNYHSYLTAAPASNFYKFGTHRGTVSGISNNTDGLGLAVANWYSFSNESWTSWNVSDGDLMGNLQEDNGADEMIDKGYRFYTVTLAEGAAVDVYVLHMDAASRQADINAREKQLTQLATAIKTNTGNNKRPAIVLGDTNCRYTRENLKSLFIDVINADSRFTVNDPWVDFMWNGVYPTYGSESMMTHAYGTQKGEVVDKVFYINTTESDLTLKANSYLHDTELTVSDHYPVVVSFTLTDPDGATVNNTLEGPAGEVVLTDGTPTDPTLDLSGQTYFLRNAHSGLYLKAARGFGSQASEGIHAMPMTFNKVSNNSYYITHTIPNCYLGDNLYLDNGTKFNWTLKEITRSDGVKKYVFMNGNNAMASEGNDEGVGFATYNAADTKQHWILYTTDMIKEEIPATIEGTTYNASNLIPYGRIETHHADTRKSYWQGNPAFSGWSNHANHAMEKWFPGNSDQKFDVYQEITGLPEGTYTLTAQAFHRDGGHGTGSTKVIPDLYATNGSSNTFTTKICSINDASAPATKPNNMYEAGDAFLNNSYKVTLSNVTVNADGVLRIGVRNTSTASNSNDLWCIFNNFQLLWHGTNTGDLKATELYRNIKAAVDEANALIAAQPASVQSGYDISAVKYRYNNNLVSADGAWELTQIDNAIRTAAKSQSTIGSDMSLAIVNNSFETGTLDGWTVDRANDTNVFPNSNATYATSGVDGNFLFNTWAPEENCPPLKQSISGLPNGYYQLKALVSSVADKTIFLIGNKQYAGKQTLDGDKVFVEHEVNFLVEDGTANIATVASYGGTFNYKKGSYFKSDNYRLIYQGTVGQGRYEITLAEAKKQAETLEDAAKTYFNTQIASYEGRTITGDGIAEATAIRNIIANACKQQKFGDAEMTWTIQNPSFETGDFTGWTVSTQWDTRILHVTDANGVEIADAQYLFNTWNDNVDAENSGINNPIKQTITDLPNGTYRVTAMVASDSGNKTFVFGNSTPGTAVQTEGNNKFAEATAEFKVTNGTAIIGAVGAREGAFNEAGGSWYKADHFRLTYLGADLTLNEDEEMDCEEGKYHQVTLNRPVKANTWSTFVAPFDIAEIGDWEVMTLSAAKENNGIITLSFEKVTAVEAGVPYMVRHTEGTNAFIVGNVNVMADLKPTTAGNVTFQPTYTPGKVPAGAYFISGNKFWKATDNTNNINAYRAYFAVNGAAEVNAISFDLDGMETNINDATTDGIATIVAIYSLDGRRIESMQRGVNIVKLSNGKTKKVIVK